MSFGGVQEFDRNSVEEDAGSASPDKAVKVGGENTHEQAVEEELGEKERSMEDEEEKEVIVDGEVKMEGGYISSLKDFGYSLWSRKS